MEKERVSPRRVRILKVKKLSEGAFPEGTRKTGWEGDKPQVGKRYYLLQDNGKVYRTGTITMVHEEGFDTDHSEYKLAVLKTEEEEREEQIKKEMDGSFDMTCEPRSVTIRCIEGSTVRGNVNLKHENRTSDLFTKGEGPFIVLFDAVIQDEHRKTLVVNKKSIAWVSIED